jgi:hypothetical protein
VPLPAAQFETAEIVGTIRDQGGPVITAAEVTLYNSATGISNTSSREG